MKTVLGDAVQGETRHERLGVLRVEDEALNGADASSSIATKLWVSLVI
jgi:hypothetical protein